MSRTSTSRENVKTEEEDQQDYYFESDGRSHYSIDCAGCADGTVEYWGACHEVGEEVVSYEAEASEEPSYEEGHYPARFRHLFF